MLNKYGFTGTSSFFQSIGKSLDNGIFITSAAIGTVALTFGSTYAGNYDISKKWGDCSGWLNCTDITILSPVGCLLLGAILFLIGAFGTYKDQNKLNTEMNQLKGSKEALNSTQEELQYSKSRLIELQKELVRTWLKGASNFLKLKHDSRITIYYENEGEFYLLARYSPNPSFSDVHRQKFPLNQGVISKAWQTGNHKEENCPHSDEVENYSDYLKLNYNYETAKIDSLNMKSCRYYAKAIVDADRHIGVIVFESIDITFFQRNISTSIDTYCQQFQSQLSKFVRDSLDFDKEINSKISKEPFVENDLIEMVEQKNG